MLKVPEHQVAGHQAHNGQLGPLIDDSGRFYKPLQDGKRGSKELAFYESFSSNPQIPDHIRRYFPAFYGTQLLEASDGSGLRSHLVLEDLVSKLIHPSIMDIKIGSRTWYPQASEDYIQRCLKKDRETSSLSLGFRVSGLQVYAGKEAEFWKPDRKLAQKLGADEVRLVLRKFVSSNPSADPDSNPDGSFTSSVYGGSVGDMMSVARGAIGPLSGVTRHVNNALRKVGAKNIQAGVGCGVGFGHGFGAGLAVKPGVVHKIQDSLVQVMTMMMIKMGLVPDSSNSQGVPPMSLQSGNEPSIQNPFGNITQLATKLPDKTMQRMPKSANLDPFSTDENAASKSNLVDTSFGGRTEQVLNSFLQNPILNKDASLDVAGGRLQSENRMLQMVLKHQQVIEELMEENKKLRRILVQDLKISPDKLQNSYSSRDKSPCSECFECRRKQRKR